MAVYNLLRGVNCQYEVYERVDRGPYFSTSGLKKKHIKHVGGWRGEAASRCVKMKARMENQCEGRRGRLAWARRTRRPALDEGGVTERRGPWRREGGGGQGEGVTQGGTDQGAGNAHGRRGGKRKRAQGCLAYRGGEGGGTAARERRAADTRGAQWQNRLAAAASGRGTEHSLRGTWGAWERGGRAADMIRTRRARPPRQQHTMIGRGARGACAGGAAARPCASRRSRHPTTGDGPIDGAGAKQVWWACPRHGGPAGQSGCGIKARQRRRLSLAKPRSRAACLTRSSSTASPSLRPSACLSWLC